MSEDGGVLWRTLSREEDLLESVLLQLDPTSLVSIELVCRNFRHFMQRRHIWKKRFDLVKHNLETAVTDNSDSVHIQFKRITLKMTNLELNLKIGNCQETKTELPIIAYNIANIANKMIKDSSSQSYNHSFKAIMHPSIMFVRGIWRDPEASLLFDVDAGKAKNLATPALPDEEEYKIKAADVAPGVLCLLRSHTTGLGGGPEVACIVETYRASDGFSLSSQSEPQERNDFGFGIKVKIAREEKILVLSFNIFGSIDEPMHARINIFEKDASQSENPNPQRLLLIKRVKCYTEGNISNLSLLQDDYVVLCAGPEDHVEVWDLRRDVDGRAAEIWTRRIVPQELVSIEDQTRRVRISALEWRDPFLLVGRTDGQLEIWDTSSVAPLDERPLRIIFPSSFLRYHQHELMSPSSQMRKRMTPTRIAVQDQTLLCLTEAGWLLAWDWGLCVQRVPLDHSSELSPNWIKKMEPIMPITTFVSSSSEIVSFEAGTNDKSKSMFLVKRDFLNHIESQMEGKTCRDNLNKKNGILDGEEEEKQGSDSVAIARLAPDKGKVG